jgi:hypothetical protein
MWTSGIIETTLVVTAENTGRKIIITVEPNMTGTTKYLVPCQGLRTSSMGLQIILQTFSTTFIAVS